MNQTYVPNPRTGPELRPEAVGHTLQPFLPQNLVGRVLHHLHVGTFKGVVAP
jgi:hypothetical protein